MPRQLTFDLPVRPALDRSDFFVSPANSRALDQIDSWPDWPAGKLVLQGPAGAGKTHLAHVWAREVGAEIVPAARLSAVDPDRLALSGRVVVEEADGLGGDDGGEAVLFHLCNLLHPDGRLLMTARRPPGQWSLSLPDLASRVATAGVARLDMPDDALLAAVMVKLFADRQVTVSPAIVSYLVPRMERSLDAVRRIVDILDSEAMAERRAIDRRLAARALETCGGATVAEPRDD